MCIDFVIIVMTLAKISWAPTMGQVLERSLNLSCSGPVEARLHEAAVPVTLPALFARPTHATLAGGLEMQKREPSRSKAGSSHVPWPRHVFPQSPTLLAAPHLC